MFPVPLYGFFGDAKGFGRKSFTLAPSEIIESSKNMVKFPRRI